MTRRDVLTWMCPLLLSGAGVSAEPVRIASYPGNGAISWQAPTSAVSTVEWASSLAPTATWYRNWLPLIHRSSPGGTGSAPAPMFYRVSSWTNGLLVNLPVGRTYTYSVSNALGQAWTETVQVIGMASIMSATDNYAVIDVREHYTGDPPVGLPEDELWVGRSTDRQVLGLGGVGSEFLIWQDAPIGTAWTNGNDVSTIVTNETVQVPAGTFTGCIRIRRIDTGESAPYNSLDEWIKPGLFMVKWVDYFGDPTAVPVVYTLTSWTDP